MNHNKEITNKNVFEQFASRITHYSGSTPVFLTACVIVLIWIISGPFFHYSDTWQLVINTGTTVITFLMVFLIQKSQNKDSIAVHLKLNELVASNDKASNRLVSVEELTEQELLVLSRYYSKLASEAKKEDSIFISHSVEEAEDNHEEKMEKKKKEKLKKK